MDGDGAAVSEDEAKVRLEFDADQYVLRALVRAAIDEFAEFGPEGALVIIDAVRVGLLRQITRVAG